MKLRISGKSVALPQLTPDERKQWTIERRPGGWLVARSPEGVRHRFCLNEKKGKLTASLSGHLWMADLVQDRHHHGASDSVGGDYDFTAQFPGKVRKVLIQAGAQVKEGDPLILVEAMKMEFAVKAPAAGTVTQVLVQEGQQLSPGDQFLEFKEAAE